MRYSKPVYSAILIIFLVFCLGCLGKTQTSTVQATPTITPAATKITHMEQTIGNNLYSFSANTIIQKTKDPDKSITFGIIADMHGNTDNVRYFISEFVNRNINGILVPGDLVEHYRNSKDDATEFKEILTQLSKVDLPVFIITGNHDKVSEYEAVLQSLNAKNLINMNQFRIADLDDADIIAIPGYHDSRFTVDGGHVITPIDYELVKQKAGLLKDPRILLVHSPPRSERDGGIDQIFSGAHVGDEKLNALLKETGIEILVCGHIHESGGVAEDENSTFIPQKKVVQHMRLNAAPASSFKMLDGSTTQGLAAILTISEEGFFYEIIER